jgi:hypothetical protein
VTSFGFISSQKILFGLHPTLESIHTTQKEKTSSIHIKLFCKLKKRPPTAMDARENGVGMRGQLT